MGGGLMQLVAHGAQDVYLTGDPQITYFKVVYRRHTNFSMECIQQQFNTTPKPGGKTSCIVSRNGDLIGAMWLEFKLNRGANTNLGFISYIKSVSIEIGGQKIDTHYGRWLDIWDDLTTDANKDEAMLTMLGNTTGTGSSSTAPTDNAAIITNEMGDCFALVPLSFWFNRNVGLALPLIALQYHEIKLNFDFASTGSANEVWSECRLWIDYIFLDSEERKRFAQMSHEYLIDQVQSETFSLTSGASSGETKRLDINFNHPIKELVWVAEHEGARQVDITNVKLQLNGHDRFYPRCGEYFRLQQPYQFHSTVPPAEDIYVYSFALRPEEHQPSGTCNFSRIDSCQMTITRSGRLIDGTSQITALSDSLYMYGINYNVLRIASGMAGLAYSN